VTIKTLRSKFYEKKLAYACSFDSKRALLLSRIGLGPGGFRTSLQPRPDWRGPAGELFHVLDALTVPGVDGAKHECPTGEIESIEESICFEPDRLRAHVQGRAAFEVTGRGSGAKSRAEPRIYMTYTGSLRFRSVPSSLFHGFPDRTAAHAREADREADRVVASAWIVPSFSTEDSRYKWLGQVGCVAFGTWTAEPREESPIVQDVTTAIDIYAAG
jgi:Protein of unknown function (DUF3237)